MAELDNHEAVYSFFDNNTGLRGFLGIHNTNLGPATGGTRMYPYKCEKEALRDVLLLSKAMTYKSALAGVPFGGGKAVIIGGSEIKSEGMLREYGKVIDSFKGGFTTGTDMGITHEDTETMATESEYILGQKNTVEKFDTSDMAALGVFFSIKEGLREIFGSPSVRGKKISINGVGKLGGELLRLLMEEGAEVVAADINLEVVEKIKSEYRDVKFVDPEVIFSQKVDAYSPCAIGGEFNEKTISRLDTKIISGGANNQLVSDTIGESLYKLGILYIPDYIANSGGLINIVDEMEENGYNKDRVTEKITSIGETVRKIINLSKARGKSTNIVANELAKKIIYESKKRN